MSISFVQDCFLNFLVLSCIFYLDTSAIAKFESASRYRVAVSARAVVVREWAAIVAVDTAAVLVTAVAMVEAVAGDVVGAILAAGKPKGFVFGDFILQFT